MPTIEQLSGGGTNQAPSGTIAGKSQGPAPVPTRTRSQKRKKKHKSFWDKAIETLEATAAGPVVTALDMFGPKKAKPAVHAYQAFAASPVDVVAYPKATARNLSGTVVGLFETPTAIGTSIRKYGLNKTVNMMWHSIKADYQDRYGPNWREHAHENPLFNLADALIVVGPTLKGVALAEAASRLTEASRAASLGERAALAGRAQQGVLVKGAGLGKTFESLSPAQKLRLSRAESKAPGVYTTGERRTRRIATEGEIPSPVNPTGTEIVTNQVLSGSPLRRTVQLALDDLAAATPDAPVIGARARQARALGRQLPRSMDRTLVSVVDANALKGLARPALSRLFWEAQLVKHTADDAGNLVFNHEDVTSRLKELRTQLADEYARKTPRPGDDPALWEWIQAAHAQGFGEQLLKRLDQGIAYKPDRRYEKAVGALRQATTVGEAILHDTEGFSHTRNQQTKLWDELMHYTEKDAQGNHVLKPAPSGQGEIPSIMPQHAERAGQIVTQLHKLTAEMERGQENFGGMLHDRRGIVSNYYATRPVTDSPERDQWATALEGLGMTPQQAEDVLRVSDNIARSAQPNDPAAWYARQVGSPTGLTPEQVRLRANQVLFQDFPEHGVTPLIEGEAGAPAATSAYYSGIQKKVADEWGKKPLRQAGQVKKQLKAGSQQEYENLELDNFFDQHDQNAMISQAELQEFMATPLNRYNLHEVHRVNSPEADVEGYGSRWGGQSYPYGEWWDQLISREPEQGGYHEITFELPRDPDVQSTIPPGAYTGGGVAHWDIPNVTGHVRFQVFEEGGKRKLVIEEVQSDWVNDYRRQTKRGIPYDPAGAEDWEHERMVLRERAAEARRLSEEAADRYERFYNSGAPESEIDAARAEARRTFQEETRAEDALDQHIGSIRSGTTPPPPLSNPKAQRLAVHRVLRFAAENDIDQVIVTDRHTQHARNMVGGYTEGWERMIEDSHGIPFAPKRVRKESLAAFPDETSYSRMYEKEIPDLIERRTGLTGRLVDDAYEGHIQTQHGAKSKRGDMRGTVFDLTAEAKARAVEPDLLYQRQPEWGNVPRGANEVLAGKGKRLIHMFQRSDASTWIHELAHSAVYDLTEADQGVLNAYYGGGKALHKWDNAAHESFARDVETFVREGFVKVPRALQEIFSRIQAWMQRSYRVAKDANPKAEIPQHVQDVFQRMLVPEADTPDIFIPHRASAPDLTGGRMSRGIPRGTRTIGTEVDPTQPLFRKNTLALLRSGMIHDDPRLLFEHVNRLTGLAKANQIREFLLEHATPHFRTDPPPDFTRQYIIKTSGTNPNKVLYDAIETAETPEEIRSTIAQFLDENIVTNQAEYDKAMRGWTGDQQLYTVDKRFADMLIRQTTGAKAGMPTKIPSNAQRVLDTSLNSLRALLLYGNPGFYVANLGGNFGMMMLNDPRAIRYLGPALRDAMKASEIGVPGSKRLTTAGRDVSPVFQRVSVEMGRGPTSGGLRIPDRILGREGGFRAQGAFMRGVDRVDYRLGRLGHGAGAIVDDAFRVATWRMEAAKLGYSTKKQVLDLLDKAEADGRKGLLSADSKALRDTAAIRDKAEQLMLDFDSMTPFERDWLARFIFLYPFLRASAKYPFMFTGEHPTLTGAMLQGSNVGQGFANEILGPRPDLPEWARGYARGPGGFYNVGSIDQLNVLGGELQSALALFQGQPPEVGVNRAAGFVHPGLQLLDELLRRQNRYGRDVSYGEILRTDFPSPAYLSSVYREPSQLYTDRGTLAALLRSLRLAPFGINPNYGQDQR